MARLRTRSLAQAPNGPAIRGVLKVDRRTKNLVERLRPGEIAVIHHENIDALAARALVDSRVAAVVNAVSSSAGRYPNTGPSILLDAGIPLIDGVGERFFNAVRDGDTIEIVGDLVRSGEAVSNGLRVSPELAQTWLKQGQQNVGRELARFARNTLEHLDTEWRTFFEPLDIPEIRTQIRGKHVVVVTRGAGYAADLAALRRFYIPEIRPVIIAVDGAADTLLEQGVKPHVLVGDMDSVTNRALLCGAEVIVHGYMDPNRVSPGYERCGLLNADVKLLRAPGTSEDAAMLLAHELGAEVIVAVGTHFSLEEFLDKGREGMSSTFLTRLKTGSKLIDAKGVSRVYSSKSSPWDYLWLVGAAALMVITAAAFSPLGQTILNTLRTKLYFR